MKLSPLALIAINTPRVRVRIAEALDCTEQTVMRYIAANNIMLTTVTALIVIRKETKLDDSKLLVEEGAISDHGGQ